MTEILRIALQRSGRLSDDSITLMRECGIDFDSNRGTSRLRSPGRNFPVEFLFLRDDDIPRYVADGVVDAGVVGENIVGEQSPAVRTVERLGFSRCRLALAVPRSSTYQRADDLAGLRIATSHPRLLEKFLTERKISAVIHEISGSVEIAPSMGLAEAICDLVSSGSTLVSNGLRELEAVLESEALLIAGKNLPESKVALLEQLIFRIRAVLKGRSNKYIVLNAPNAALGRIIDILPGMKSPTVVPLALEGWSAVHSVVTESEFWEIIENLRAAGAQGILVIPVEKMIV